jgi:hypothetical protein
MAITAKRAAEKVKRQNGFIRKTGSKTTIAEFRAGQYLRRIRALLNKVKRTTKLLIREESKLLRAIMCGEKASQPTHTKDKKNKDQTNRFLIATEPIRFQGRHLSSGRVLGRLKDGVEASSVLMVPWYLAMYSLLIFRELYTFRGCCF